LQQCHAQHSNRVIRHAIHTHFFFSSRRRHTRWPRDWSSDVCSSDLSLAGCLNEGLPNEENRDPAPAKLGTPPEKRDPPKPTPPRSEERRVGKECRSRWEAYH